MLDSDVAEVDVSIDQMRTQQVFINLISNAIKFSKPLDKILIKIEKPELIDKKTNLCKFVFKVTDQGLGMNDYDRKNLFKPYFKSSCEKSRIANANSNGIGLSHCKKLAKCLGGDLTLSEAYRDGCQFIFEMKAALVDVQKRRKAKKKNKRRGKRESDSDS